MSGFDFKRVNGSGDGGLVCLFCSEPVTDEHIAELAPGPLSARDIHRECAMRAVIGGVNHQRGTCHCHGGPDDPDPPGLSAREAAIAAAYFFDGAQTMTEGRA